MARLRVHAFTVSLDGFAAGPDQSHDAPFGTGGDRLHEWMFATRSMQRILGSEGGTEGPDDDEFRAGFDNIGATIMGRNMFGPQRGAWADESWQGWWGDTPPYGHDVFVMTRHGRPDLSMNGGTTFHFVDDTPERVLAMAADAAGGKDVRVGGGAATVRAFLAAGLVDELHLVIAPILLGRGERLFDDSPGTATLPEGYTCTELTGSGAATHARIVRS